MNALTAMSISPATPFKFLTNNCYPIATKSRRYNIEDRLFIDSEIKRMLFEGIIEPAQSPWRAQVLVARTGKPRMVIDYSQTINKFTLLDAYPLPNIENLVNTIAQYSYFSSIDLKSAYHQIPLASKDKVYTAFEANGKLYQFNRLSFGLTNGVACFQRAIDQILEKENQPDTYAYIDDITVCGRTKLEHDTNLQLFFELAKTWNFTINYEKSKFSQTTIKLLGYEISHGVIKPDPDRLRPLLDYPFPTTKKSLERLTGMLAYYAKWIPNFSHKIRPLTSASLPLNPALMQNIISMFNDLTIAARGTIDENKEFTVETDASDDSIAATLSQEGRPVAFFSRCLNSSEMHHSSIEKEAYAIIEAVRRWKHLLQGRHFHIITDQKSVSFMFAHHTSKIKNDKVERWRLELMPLSYDIIYRAGKHNYAADALSRVSTDYKNEKKLKNDSIGNQLLAVVNENTSTILKIHGKLIHPGVTRLWHYIRTKNLPYTLEEVRTALKSCPICPQIKPQFVHYKASNSPTLINATKPFDQLSLDFKGPVAKTREGYLYLLIAVDEYSRFPFAFPCKDLTAGTVIRHLKEIFSVFGLPSYVHSDRGSAFMSAELKQYLLQKGIPSSRTTSYHATGNSQCERYVGLVWQTIQLHMLENNLSPGQWTESLPEVLSVMRSLLSTATNETPHQRLFKYPRRFVGQSTIPDWMFESQNAYLRRHVRSKQDPIVDPVKILEVNPYFTYIQRPDGRQDTVSNRDLAPCPESTNSDSSTSYPINSSPSQTSPFVSSDTQSPSTIADSTPLSQSSTSFTPPTTSTSSPTPTTTSPPISSPCLRRSSRISKPPDRFNFTKF